MKDRSFSSLCSGSNNSFDFVECFAFFQGLSHLSAFILTTFFREVGQGMVFMTSAYSCLSVP